MSQVRNCMPSLSQNTSLDREKQLMNNVTLCNPRIRFTGSRSCVLCGSQSVCLSVQRVCMLIQGCQFKECVCYFVSRKMDVNQETPLSIQSLFVNPGNVSTIPKSCLSFPQACLSLQAAVLISWRGSVNLWILFVCPWSVFFKSKSVFVNQTGVCQSNKCVHQSKECVQKSVSVN